MFIRRRRGWQLRERDVTPESVYLNRRAILRAMGVAVAAGGPAAWALARPRQGVSPQPQAVRYPSGPAGDLYPAAPHPKLTAEDAGRPITPPEIAHAYNNFYEFYVPKENVWKHVDRFETEPWTFEVAGLVNKPGKYDLEQVMRRLGLEERICRFRCVEAWSAVIPWTGFPFRALLEMLEPKAEARYVAMTTANRPEQMPGIPDQPWYPWPYHEALTLQEAANELAFLATGSYGKPQPKQNGAPLRLIVPWKFGFKNVKSIVRFEFTREQPETFWHRVTPHEYGFWANINPEVPHPRWSQATERFINTGERVPTRLYNGYGEWVAPIYAGLENKLGAWLFR